MPQNITVFYPNMIKLFKECPFRFHYKYNEQIPVPLPDKGFITGKNIHSLALYYLKREDITKFEKRLSPKENELWKKLKENPYFKYEIVGTEKNILSKTGNYWIGGRIDALVKNENDYYILDYKTGGVNNDMTFDEQTMVYLILCDNFIKEYNSLSFVYLDLKNNREIKIEFSPELKEKYLDKLKSALDEINSFNPDKQEKKENCQCEYEKLCKFN